VNRALRGAVILLTGLAPACTKTADESATEVDWVVLPDSFGPVPLGVPVEQATRALDDAPQVGFTAAETCTMVRAESMPAGSSLMVLRDTAGALIRVDRVDIDSAGTLTREGAGVGDSESRIDSLYGSRLQVQPHKYTPEGHYLIVPSERDSAFRIVFETDGQHVTRFHAGRRPAVDFVERCG
jgi:hypothetical protein